MDSGSDHDNHTQDMDSRLRRLNIGGTWQTLRQPITSTTSSPSLSNHNTPMTSTVNERVPPRIRRTRWFDELAYGRRQLNVSPGIESRAQTPSSSPQDDPLSEGTHPSTSSQQAWHNPLTREHYHSLTRERYYPSFTSENQQVERERQVHQTGNLAEHRSRSPNNINDFAGTGDFANGEMYLEVRYAWSSSTYTFTYEKIHHIAKQWCRRARNTVAPGI
jgi:hypothetical protein